MSLFTAKELANFSVTKALSELSSSSEPGIDGRVTGLELECSDALKQNMKRRTGSAPNGFMLPIACLKGLNVTTAQQGGFLTGLDVASIVPALRSASVSVALGATVLENLKAELGVPVESTTNSAVWLSESGALPDPTDLAFTRALLTPRKLASLAVLSRQLLDQNSAGVESFVRTSLMRTVGTALDAGVIAGTGGVQPRGILNQTGTGSVTFGGAATFAKAIGFQDALTTANAGYTPDASLAYVTTPATAAKWMQIAEVATYPQFLWSGSEWSGTVAGLPARSTNNVTGDKVLLGNWAGVFIGFYSEGLSIISDSFAQKKSGLIEFYCQVYADSVVPNPANFCVSLDSGAQ